MGENRTRAITTTCFLTGDPCSSLSRGRSWSPHCLECPKEVETRAGLRQQEDEDQSNPISLLLASDSAWCLQMQRGVGDPWPAVLAGLAANCATGLLHCLILPAGLAGHRKSSHHGGECSLGTTGAATEAQAHERPGTVRRGWDEEQPSLQCSGSSPGLCFVWDWDCRGLLSFLVCEQSSSHRCVALSA